MSRTKHAPRPEGMQPPRRERLIDKRWRSVDDAATLLGCSASRVYELVHAGDLESVQPSRGSRIRVSEDSVEAYLARGHRAARAS